VCFVVELLPLNYYHVSFKTTTPCKTASLKVETTDTAFKAFTSAAPSKHKSNGPTTRKSNGPKN
jgi:hypothetical protein